MSVRIRPSQASDVRARVEILREWDGETPWLTDLNPLPQLLEFWGGVFAHETVWVAEDDGCVAGFCWREDDGTIGALYVATAARGAGLGKRLLDRAKEGCPRITVWAYQKNAAALRFYAREGLVQICCEPEEGTGLINIEHRWTRPDGTDPTLARSS